MFKYIGRSQFMMTAWSGQPNTTFTLMRQVSGFATNNVIVDPNMNKYQES